MSCLYSYTTRLWRRKPALIGLVVVLLIFLACVYDYHGAPGPPVYVRLQHKKLQGVITQSIEPVQFIQQPHMSDSVQAPGARGNLNIQDINNQHYQAMVEDKNQEESLLGNQNGVQGEYIPQGENQQVPWESGERVEPGISSDLSAQSLPLYIPAHRIVHLDLKGAPPSVDYLKQVLRISQGLGATGVLVEWEDMFPWSGRLSPVAAKNHYSEEEGKELLKACQELGLDVIPLVQTFGHMEFVLKHKEFSYLRDVEEMPESICPCHNDTMGIVREIVDQVMAVHKDAKYLHIGCDEVFHLGECSECLGVGRTSIFTDHVTRVAQYVRQAYQVTPIIWDDMLRNLIVEEMQPLAKLVEPMVWVYAEDVERFVPSYTWDRYNQVFDYFWTASAFKGAHGETLVVPDVQRHLNNNLNWLALMAQEEPRIRGGFRGIVLTGWQRYDHFAVLCELLPAAIPSLAVNLLATSHGFFNETLEKPLAKALGCVQHTSRYSSSLVDLQNDNFLWTGLSWCYFPGTNFFKVTKNLVAAEREVGEFLHKVESKKGWLTEYNRRHNMSSPFRIDEGLEDWSQVHHSVVSIMQSANAALLEMFDHYTVSEWIEQKLYPLYSKLSSIKNQADDLRRVKYWPARPYPPLEALKGLGIGVPDIQESAELRRTPEPKFSKFIDQDNFV